jgi:membrane-associated phospholipid phosphatase
MSITLAVLAVALACAAIAYAQSMSKTGFDPIDPEAELGWLVRRLGSRPRLVRFARARLDRTTATGLALSVAFAIVFATALAVGSLADMVSHHSGFARFDKSVANWGVDHVTSGSVTTLRRITDLGSTPVVIVVAALVGVAMSVYRKRPGPAAFMLTVVAGQLLLNNALKLAVNRDRPDVARFVSTTGSSFPSGHTTAAAATWAAVALAITYGRSARLRAVIGAGAAMIAVAVGATRALLGAHWLTDVLAGLALGWGWFFLVALTFGGRMLRAAGGAERIAGQQLPTTPGSDGPTSPSSTDRIERSRPDRHALLLAARHVVAFLVLTVAACTLVGTAVGWLIVHIVDHSSVGHADSQVNVWAAAHRTGALNSITSFLSQMGSTRIVVGLALLAVVVLRLRLRRWLPSIIVAFGLVVEVSSFVLIANLVDRARPDVVRLDPSPPTSSFPSGHTAASVALYVGVAWVIAALVQRQAARRLVWSIGLVLPLLVAAGRVYRGMHHPTDVLAGLILGVVGVVVANGVVGGWHHPSVTTTGDQNDDATSELTGRRSLEPADG